MLLVSVIALAAAASQPSFAQTPTPEQLAQRAIERRAVEAVIWGMPAVNYDLMLQEMLTKTAGKVNQIDLLGPAARLAQPDADAESRHALLHGVLQHQGRRADRDRYPAGERRRLAQRQHRQHLADAAGGRGAARRRQGQGRQIPDAAARLFRTKFPRAISRCSPAHSAATRCSVRTSRAIATPTSRSPWPTANGSRSIRFRKRPIRRRRCSPTSRMSLFDSTIRYDASFFEGSTGSCRASRGSIATGSMIDQLKSLGIEKGKPFAPDCRDEAGARRGIREAQMRWRRDMTPACRRFSRARTGPSRLLPNSSRRQQDFAEPTPIRSTRAAWPTAMPISASSGWAPASST